MPSRLNEESLSQLDSVALPQYSRKGLKTGIVHLGTGAFHRGHQAVYTDSLLATDDNRWGIVGASLRSRSVHDAIAPQDFLYTVSARSAGTKDLRIIGSIQDIIVLPEAGQLQRLAALIANPDTHAVTLTITEKGYCHDHMGDLDSKNPSIIEDLKNPTAPKTAPGVLAYALKQRMLSEAGGITILSCDNVAGNGSVTRNVVEAMVSEISPDASDWVANNASFPTSMVDRIVPQTNTGDIDEFTKYAGYEDQGLVICEPYSQWIIEDNFAGERPNWASVGAQFVTSTQPYEQAKLRLLNATHSALAYLGLLSAHEYVHQAMSDHRLASFVRAVMDTEITPAVQCPDGMDLEQYKDSILDRFKNSDIPYATQQVASDGSQKLPQRILPTIEHQLRDNGPTSGLFLVVAAWLHCLLLINDPQATDIIEFINKSPNKHLDAEQLVRAIAEKSDHFGNLSHNERFLADLAVTLAMLQQKGSQACVDAYLKARR
ncbi:MAG: fructuronate reductase [Candidatus Azotimanducaceae bacterium]|jgi:fructuronate reductase